MANTNGHLTCLMAYRIDSLKGNEETRVQMKVKIFTLIS